MATSTVAAPALVKYRMYIGGQWVDAASGELFESDNPYTGQPWALIPRGGPADVDRAVQAAHWRSPPATGRSSVRRGGALLRKLGDLVAEHAKALAEVEVRDNGKLLAEMGGQTAYMAHWFHYYAGLADKIEGAVIPVDKPEMFNYTRHEPLGVIGAIVPWNSPLLLAAWKMAPALAAGNTMVIKPSEYTSASALELMKLVEQAGFPPGSSTSSPGSAPTSASARRASARRQDRVHRLGRHRPEDLRRPPRADSSASRWSSAASRRTSCSTTRIWTTRRRV